MQVEDLAGFDDGSFEALQGSAHDASAEDGLSRVHVGLSALAAQAQQKAAEAGAAGDVERCARYANAGLAIANRATYWTQAARPKSRELMFLVVEAAERERALGEMLRQVDATLLPEPLRSNVQTNRREWKTHSPVADDRNVEHLRRLGELRVSTMAAKKTGCLLAAAALAAGTIWIS